MRTANLSQSKSSGKYRVSIKDGNKKLRVHERVSDASVRRFLETVSGDDLIAKPAYSFVYTREASGITLVFKCPRRKNE